MSFLPFIPGFGRPRQRRIRRAGSDYVIRGLRQLKRLVPIAAFAFFGARMPAHQDQGQDVFSVNGYPAAMQKAAVLTVKRCSKCHTIERVAQALYKGAAWKQLVNRMSKKRRARITRKEGSRIAEFLTYHTSSRKSSRRELPRKGLQGRTDVFPRRRFAVLQSTPVPDMLSPPFEIELENQPLTIGEISRKDIDLPGESVSMTGQYRGSAFRVSLARGSNGFTSAGTETIHAWTIGPYHFRVVLALWMPPSDEDLPELALLVERVARSQ